MKQAILITAYKNIHHLEQLISFFDEDFQVYVHLDKKSAVSPTEVKRLQKLPQLALLSRHYKVNWGGLQHVNSILHLAQAALANKELTYAHLISGHDFPIKPCHAIKSYMEQHKGEEFLDYFALPREQPGWENGGYGRLNSYHLYDYFNAKSKEGLQVLDFLGKAQYRLGIARSLPAHFPPLYGGSTWWTLSASCLRYTLRYLEENPWFTKRFRHTFCPEEMFFQTIIMNSGFAERVVNNNLRYIDWEERNGNAPANLDSSDFPKLKTSEALFARKFEYPVSEELLKLLQDSWLASTK